MRVEALGPAIFPLLAAWVLSSRAGTGRWIKALAAAADALALVSVALLWNAGLPRSGALDADPFSLFLASSVLAALAFATVAPRQDVDSLCHLHLGASLSIVAVSTRDLPWSVPAILVFGMFVRRGREHLLGLVASSLVSLVGLSLVAAFGQEAIGLFLLSVGLSAVWLVVSRELLRSSPSGLVTGMAGSFALLVAVSSVHLRIAAWFPANAPLETIHALALVALTLGALGSLGATRVTTFLTALALTRAGLVLFAFLGGIQARVPLLLELAASGVSLLLVAAAAEKLDTLDDVSKLSSVARRVVLTLGALSASSFAPFPGFVVAFPLSSAVLDGGHPFSLILACALLFLSSLGSMRLVARAWGSDGSRTVDTTVGAAPVALALAAAWFLAAAPERAVEVAMAAARSIF
ncbi:MAG TPA: hypothetical protein VIE88_06335 [Vicinamibacteria bacterium]|jgi:hypothetical protein